MPPAAAVAAEQDADARQTVPAVLTESTSTNKAIAAGKQQPSKQAAAAAPIDQATSAALAQRIAALEGEARETEPARAEAAAARKRALRQAERLAADGSKSAEERLDLLRQKFAQQVADNGRAVNELIGLRRECEQLRKEKEEGAARAGNAQALSDRLAELCRGLQAQVRALQADKLAAAQASTLAMQQQAESFGDKIGAVQASIAEQAKAREEYAGHTTKLQESLQTYQKYIDTLQKQHAKELKQAALEKELAEKQAEQQALLCRELGQALAATQAAARSANEREAAQAGELANCHERFTEFSASLKANMELCTALKTELEKKAKRIGRLERENRQLAQANSSLSSQVVALSGEVAEAGKVRLQKERLEGLCRAQQAQLRAAQAAHAGAPGDAPDLPALMGSLLGNTPLAGDMPAGDSAEPEAAGTVQPA